MVVLLVLVAGGAWLFGLPGALGAYVIGLVGASLFPEGGGACAVPRPEAPAGKAHPPETEALSRRSPPAA